MPRTFSLSSLLGLQTVGGLACGFLAAASGVISTAALFWFTAVAGTIFSIMVAALRRTSFGKQIEIALYGSFGYALIAAYLAILAFAIRGMSGRLPTPDNLETTRAVVACFLFAGPAGVVALALMRQATWTYWDHHDSPQS